MPLSLSGRVAIEELLALHGHLTDDGDLGRYDDVIECRQGYPAFAGSAVSGSMP
ncbi:MAG: hypothetical protein ABI658_19870 [Acidimicrobiales bacterium]